MNMATAIWMAAVAYASPMMLAALGEVISERAGVMNLGLEGMIAVGALVGYGVSADHGSAWLGLAAGGGVGLLLGAVHAALAVWIGADQIVAGLGMSLAATGAAAFLGPMWITWRSQPAFISELSASRYKALLGFPPTTYLALALGLIAVSVLSGRRLGIAIRASGDSPEAAEALGVRVRAVRSSCVLVGGMLAGLSGAILSLAYAQTWTSTMPNGMGWIIIALVPLSGWRPGRVMLFCLLLAAVNALQIRFQIIGVKLSASILDMMPYVATLIAVIAGRIWPWRKGRWNEPSALGRPLEQ